jgi:hypothetical protein
MDERDLRKVILLLVQAHKMRESQAAAFRLLILAILEELARRKAGPPLAEVETELWKIRARTDLLADNEAQQVEAALNGESDFLEALRVYTSRQFGRARIERSLL